MLPSPFLAAAFFAIAAVASALNSDGLSLLALKVAVSADPNGALATWSDSDSDFDPCSWDGVTCTRRRVTGLVLSRRGLSGYIPSQLGAVSTLRRLSLAHNNFSQPIPTRLFNLTALIYLDLSDNALAGPLPAEIGALPNLTHLDLSSNLLNGSLPGRLSDLRSLAGTLNLSCNLFSGEVPPSYGNLPLGVSLDLRRNNLTGEIPQVGSLLNQGPTAFTENPTLCGFPLQTPCPGAQNQNTNFVADPLKAKNHHPPLPTTARDSGKRGRNRNGGAVTVLLVAGASLAVVAVVVSVSAWLFRKRGGFAEGKMGRGEKTPKEVAEDVEGQMGKYAVVDKGFGLELEDLLGATAHMVSKSRSGILYKVLVARGCCARPQLVAVRRLSESSDAGGEWRLKEFAAKVDAMGRVRHPNIVPLRAYYYASNEKLLVSDFIGNGSLYTAIHGEGGGAFSKASPPPLTWAARLKIAQGMARGLTYIHECGPQKHVHGNLKSSKILLDGDLHPYISGFGLSGLVSGTSSSTSANHPLTKKKIPNQLMLTAATGPDISVASPSSAAYVAPEAWPAGSKLTQKCDVYSFGIVLLEILTGRKPGAVPENDGKRLESLVWGAFRKERPLSEIIDPRLLPEVNAKDQAVAVFHVALNCTEADPRLRPRMRAVAHSLDSLRLC